MSASAIEPAALPLSTKAPGKCILFGEHAVVHGRPEVLFAIDLHVQVTVAPGPSTSLNRDARARETNAYFRESLERLWSDGPPVAVTAVSRVPKSAGLGSSAAFTAAFASALAAATGGITRPRLAERAFAIERAAQGVGSPGDTSAVVAGGFLTVNAPKGEELWSVVDGDRSWTVRRAPNPNWTWVLGYSGVRRSTADAVRSVGRRLSEPDGEELLGRFERVALEGLEALEAEDRERTGRLLAENHRLLREVGVSHPRLEALIEAAAPAAEGGKLTGAGAGGSVVVLPRAGRELEVARRIARAGGVPYVVRSDPGGADLVA